MDSPPIVSFSLASGRRAVETKAIVASAGVFGTEPDPVGFRLDDDWLGRTLITSR